MRSINERRNTLSIMIFHVKQRLPSIHRIFDILLKEITILTCLEQMENTIFI